MLKIFIGYDPRESVAWHVLVHSIIESATVPVTICPLNIKSLASDYKRTGDARQSNEFSYTRFLVPHLCGYEGYALYMDCDMLLRRDVKAIFKHAITEPDRAVHVVKHDYVPKNTKKYLGATQHAYPRKNWSSLVLWNCAHLANRVVTTEFVNSATPAELHRFSWLANEDIGELPLEWNFLVGEYSIEDSNVDDVANVHWTIGGPYFHEYENSDFSDDWREMKKKMLHCDQLT